MSETEDKLARQWKGESAEELVAKDICPKCFSELDTGWECNKCGFDGRLIALSIPEKQYKEWHHGKS